jgi:hypothetical protein
MNEEQSRKEIQNNRSSKRSGTRERSREEVEQKE